MPIPFSTIAEDLQFRITEKLSLTDFKNFNESSRETLRISKKMRRIYTYSDCVLSVEEDNDEFVMWIVWKSGRDLEVNLDSVDELPIRLQIKIFIVDVPLSEDLCDWLLKFIITTKSSISLLRVGDITCVPEDFNNLLEAANVRKIFADNSLALDYIRVPSMKNIESLHTSSPLDDFDVLSLRAGSLNLKKTNITSAGINLFLKEWKNGERVIFDIRIQTLEQLDGDIILKDNILEGGYTIVNKHNTKKRIYIQQHLIDML